jgi:hypothetical protein
MRKDKRAKVKVKGKMANMLKKKLQILFCGFA